MKWEFNFVFHWILCFIEGLVGQRWGYRWRGVGGSEVGYRPRLLNTYAYAIRIQYAYVLIHKISRISKRIRQVYFLLCKNRALYRIFNLVEICANPRTSPCSAPPMFARNLPRVARRNCNKFLMKLHALYNDKCCWNTCVCSNTCVLQHVCALLE